jgi:hypothetical protein
LLILTVADLLLLSRHRVVETAPIRPLAEQSPVLGRLAALPPGSRTIDPFRNLPMLVGAAPVSAYRTLDRPALSGLVALAGSPRDGSVPPGLVDAAARAVGASVRVHDVFEKAPTGAEAIRDPALASWLYGRWAERHPESAVFRWQTTGGPPPRAWFVPGLTVDDVQSPDPALVLEILGRARPAEYQRIDAERFAVAFEADRPGVLIVSVLDDPGWTARDARGARLQLDRVFATPGGGAWQGVAIPGGGTRNFSWHYEPRRSVPFPLGFEAAGMSWAIWLVVVGRGVCLALVGREPAYPASD